MDKISKLFQKISKGDKVLLLEIVDSLMSKKGEGLNIKKLQGSDFYRLRKKRFRIIFHHNASREIIIDSSRLRDEKTYK